MSEERAEYKADETKGPESETKAPSGETKAPASEAEQALAARVAELEGQLAAKDSELSEAKKTLDAQAADINTFKTGNQAAVAAYRKLAVSSNPIFTEELLTGSTIEEVQACMQKVSGLAAGIRARLEAELKETIIPAGAPERSGPDTSGMSPREKIKQGLNK